MKKKFNFNFEAKTKPFPHQIEAIEYIVKNEHIPLFDEQGLGKTKIVIDALCRDMEKGKIDGVLVVCKKHLIENWKEEIEAHSFLKFIVLRGSKNEKGTKFMGYAHFYIINYESVIGEINRLKMFMKIRKMAVVLDESHRIKNPGAKSTKALFELKDLAYKKIIITGSPVADKPLDLWAQFYFLDNGLLMGNNYKEFSKRYSVDLKSQNFTIEKNRLGELQATILNNSIRRLKEDVLELPGKIYMDKVVDLNGRQLSLYNQLKDELYIEITNLNGKTVIDNAEEILKKILRLVQIASNPFLIDKAYDETPAKFTLLDCLIDEIVRRKEKVIVWSSFVDNIRLLNKRYATHGTRMIYGDIPIEKRKEIVKQFKNNTRYKILIANPAAAKEGLTLTSANNAVYLDRNFSLVDYLQSQDRIHRISQTKKCNIYKLIARDTIDQYVDEIIYRKHKIAEFVQGDVNDIHISSQITKEQLLSFLRGAKNDK